MNIKKILLYVSATIVFVVLYGFNPIYCLFLMGGVGLGLVLHDWIKNMYDDTVNSFFTNESRKREMRKKELEQELEKYKKVD